MKASVLEAAAAFESPAIDGSRSPLRPARIMPDAPVAANVWAVTEPFAPARIWATRSLGVFAARTAVTAGGAEAEAKDIGTAAKPAPTSARQTPCLRSFTCFRLRGENFRVGRERPTDEETPRRRPSSPGRTISTSSTRRKAFQDENL